MSIGAQRGKIRVLYLGRSPDQPAFALLREGSPDISLATATQPEEVGRILRAGFDCLIVEEGKPYIDAAKITKAVRSEGFSHLPVIVHRGEGQDDEDARRLAEAIRKTRQRTRTECGKRKGQSASPIG